MPPQAFPFVCNSYAYEEEYEVMFPDTVSISHLPRSIEFSENGHRYRAKYSLDGNLVRITRLLEIETPSDVCQPGDEDTYNKLLGIVQADLRGQILYLPSKDVATNSTNQDKRS